MSGGGAFEGGGRPGGGRGGADDERRFFSRDEANELVPELASRFERINESLERIREITGYLSGLGGAHPGALRVELRVRYAVIQNEVGEIRAWGCVVKDLGSGLVDFWHRRGGEEVFLCWRYGEELIDHYHDPDEGFAGRKPLSGAPASDDPEEGVPEREVADLDSTDLDDPDLDDPDLDDDDDDDVVEGPQGLGLEGVDGEDPAREDPARGDPDLEGPEPGEGHLDGGDPQDDDPADDEDPGSWGSGGTTLH